MSAEALIGNHCKDGRERHRFLGGPVCIICGKGNPNGGTEKTASEPLVGIAPVKTMNALPSATQLKLELTTQLLHEYETARTRLMKHLEQHTGAKVEEVDALWEIGGQYLDQLYKDHGRDQFWKGKT